MKKNNVCLMVSLVAVAFPVVCMNNSADVMLYSPTYQHQQTMLEDDRMPVMLSDEDLQVPGKSDYRYEKKEKKLTEKEEKAERRRQEKEAKNREREAKRVAEADRKKQEAEAKRKEKDAKAAAKQKRENEKLAIKRSKLNQKRDR